jgi:hypothetical protein
VGVAGRDCRRTVLLGNVGWDIVPFGILNNRIAVKHD